MIILSVENLSKSYGPKSLFAGLTFGVEQGEKIGIIGINGTGKSTFLKVLAGQETADQGRVVFGNDVTVDYLPQNPEFVAGTDVIGQVFRGTSPVMQVLREYETALAKLQSSPEDTCGQNALLRLSQRMDELGAWQLESEAKAVLTRLGITDFSAKVEQLSGGMRKRIALASALISPADLLILDEPTNHLDYQTVEWLEEYLQGRKGALLMVTHDRYFLDRVVTKIFELDQGKLYVYEGNYSLFLKAKLVRLEQAEATEAKRQNLIRNELAWIKRGARARSTKQKARIDRFHQLVEQTPEAVRDKIGLTAASSRLGKKVIEFAHVGKALGGKTVLHDFSYVVQKNDRIGVVGPNGYGKSTLLNLTAGRLEPDQGEIEVGPTVKIGYFSQESSELDDNQRVINYLKEVGEVVDRGDGVRITAGQMLEQFLFPAPMQWNPIGSLSGGEKRRLFLLRILMGAPNVLLLDEPTNDLDTQTLSILEDYLEDFSGAVIAVSHDRYFLDRIGKRIFAFHEGGVVKQYVGSYSDYAEQLAAEKQLTGKNEPAGTKSKATLPSPKTKPLKFSFKEQREYETIDATVAGAEKRLQEINEQIDRADSDYVLLQELVKKQQEGERRLAELVERWTYLNELAEQIERNKKA